MDSDELRVSQVAKQLHTNIERNLRKIAEYDPSTSVSSILSDIQQFQSCPQLLYRNLDLYIDLLQRSYIDSTNSAKDSICEIFYTFAKVVGIKKILNFMKTDINLLPVIISKLRVQPHWHEEFLILCFLVVLSFVPFALDTLEGNVKSSLFNIGLQYLQTAGPLQPLGARLLGTLIMRSDCDDLLQGFIQEELISKYDESSDIVKNGLLSVLNISMQCDSEFKFKAESPRMFKFLQSIDKDETKAAVIGKIYSKLTWYLSERGEYDEIEDILEFFNNNFSNKNTETRLVLARKFSKMMKKIDPDLAIEVVVDLIHGTQEYLNNEPMETMSSELLHSKLLTLAELLRLKLIDDAMLGRIKDIVRQTLFFQQARITFISGSNVRDASSYVIWSLARSATELDPELVKDLVLSLFFVCTFDKEILIRRSATAALQELVGRHGMNTWKHLFPNENDDENSLKSVKVIEALDFVELGSIEKSYLKMPLEVITVFPNFKKDFIEFLTNNVFNLDNELVKLSAKALGVLLKEEREEEIRNVLGYLVRHSKPKTFNSFIGISEVLPLATETSQLIEILPVFNEIRLNHHKNSPFVIESYLHLLRSLLRLGHVSGADYLENLFDAIRVESETISEVLKDIAPLIQLSEDDWKKWLHYMKNNNLNTARAVTYLPDFEHRIADVLALLNDERSNADIKAALLGSISMYLKVKKVDEYTLKELVQLLDDYSVSEQGDVGSKVRLATISLIAENLNAFEKTLDVIEPKLLRLSAEPIDRLRVQSLTLLLRLKGLEPYDFNDRDIEKYFRDLLKLYHKHYADVQEVSKEFWKGYIFSGGALKATDSLITSTLRTFVEYYEKTLSDSERKVILLQLASILKVDSALLKENSYKSQRLSKMILVGLQFYSRILQLHITIPKDFNIRGLYVRVYNLHLNTQSITRLGCAIKIFGYLTIAHDLKDSRDRLVWLATSHSIARVRVLASEELFMVYTEKSLVEGMDRYSEALEVLRSTDWSGKDLKRVAESINVS